jgi:hypothetical protein
VTVTIPPFQALQFNPTQANALFMKAQMYYTMAKAYHHLGQKYLGNKHMQIANELDPKGNHKQKGKQNNSEKIIIFKKILGGKNHNFFSARLVRPGRSELRPIDGIFNLCNADRDRNVGDGNRHESAKPRRFVQRRFLTLNTCQKK